MKILIDVMGGDNAPKAPIEAAVKAVNELDVHMVLVGDTEIIENELKDYKYPEDKISIADAPEVISNYDEPTKAVRKKKTASVVVAANMLKNGLDKVHRDGFHADLGHGRFALALTWFEFLTGKDCREVQFNNFDIEVSEKEIEIAKKSAHEAVSVK